MAKKEKSARYPDFWLTIAQEAKQGSGEDSWCRCFSQDAGLLAVFDGCGGLGAQRHADYGPDGLRRAEYQNQTEAYMASRLCAGAFYDAFQSLPAGQTDPAAFHAQVCDYCARLLAGFKPDGGGLIRGAMVKPLPSTAAAALVFYGEQSSTVCPMWAGDSRVYLLTRDGLAQLTTDDATVSDPMANLYDDGVLRNVLAAGSKPLLNSRCVPVNGPFLVFSATDGCFGYFSTPMEFEGAVLESLESAANVLQWENALQERMAQVAGDDFTLNLAAYGFGSFLALKQQLLPRLETLRQEYLLPVSALPTEDRAAREALWAGYRPNYLRYMKDGT